MNSFQQGDWGLVLLGVITSLISAYYYLRIVKAMWFEKIETREVFTDTPITSLQTLRSYFYLSATSPQTPRFTLYVSLTFLTTFLAINKYMLALSYQLAIACSFADVAS
jgi:NADH:ubiquinone oxidoreductase subunit 2 (subunit N)